MNMGIPVKLLLTLALGCVCLSVPASAMTVKAVYVNGPGSSYAVDASGDLWVWGEYHGQCYVHPTRVPFIDHVAAVSPGSFDTVALKEDGTVWAWGSFDGDVYFYGQNSSLPVQINISDVKSIAYGSNSVYMVKADGGLWMCGSTLFLGPDDFWHPKHFLDPVRLPIDNVSRVEVAHSFVYAERDDGSWWAWGENSDYQLNDGTNVSRELPVKVLLGDVKSVRVVAPFDMQNYVYVPRGSVLALTGDGQVYGWGDNINSVAGDSKFPRYVGDGDDRKYVISSPHAVPGLDNMVAIGCGSSYYVALRGDGTVWAWGSNFAAGDMQSALDSNTPVKLPGFSDIVSIAVGDDHLLAVKKDGSVWAWGNNQFGQLGNGEISTFGGKPYAVQVTDLYVEMPSKDNKTVTPLPSSGLAPGFSFFTMGLLCCIFIVAIIVSGFTRRGGR